MSYPIVLTHLNQRRCIVVGGGQVAERKVRALIDAGAHPLVISPEVTTGIRNLANEGCLSLTERVYASGDLDQAWLVVAATSDHATNEAVAAECRTEGILLNVVDEPELCTFTVPSVIRRGQLLLAVSTDGQAPAFSRYMRQVLEATVDEAYGQMLALLSDLRPLIRSQVASASQAFVWDRLLDGEIIECLRREGLDAARHQAEEVVQSCLEQKDE